MNADVLDNWIDSRGSVLESLLLHRFLKPPYGYVIGIALWSVYLAIWYGTVFASENLGIISFDVSVIVALGGLLITGVVSALVMCVSAWRTPHNRIREHFVRVSGCLLVAPILFVVYFAPPPMLPNLYAVLDPLGLDVFVEHAMITTGLVGPLVGFAFLVFPLLVLGYRYRLK